MRFLKKFSLRKRIYLLLSLVLCLILGGIGIFLLTKPQETGAAWWDETWTYRKRIPISNPVTLTTNQYIKIDLDTSSLISAGKLQSGCQDLRITNHQGSLLPFFVDGDPTYTCNTASSAIYILVDNIPEGESSIYLYYGNPSATSGEVKTGSLNIPGLSCKTIADHTPSNRRNGTYYITPTGNLDDAMEVECDLTNNDGGWTKVYEGLCTSAAKTTLTYGNVTEISHEELTFDDMWVSAKYWDYSETGTTTETATMAETFSWYFEWLFSQADGDSPNVKFYSEDDGIQDVQFTSLGIIMNGYGNSWRRILPRFYVHDSLEDYMYLGALSGTGINYGDWNDYGASDDRYNTEMNRATPRESGLNLTPAEFQTIKTWIRADSINLDIDQSIGTLGSEEVSPGPIGYWKLDEGSGSSVYDSSGKGSSGIFNDSPTWLAENQCVTGNCLSFDNVDDGINIADQNYTLLSDFTMCSWVNPSGNHKNYTGTIISSGDWNYEHWAFGLNQNNTEIDTRRIDGAHSPSWSYTFPLNEWSHVCIARSGTDVKAYVNAKQIGSTYTGSLGNLVSDETFTSIGKDTYTSTEYFAFNGGLDEVKIYPYARDADQIKTDYLVGASAMGSKVVLGDQAETTSTQPLEGNLIGYWKFDKGTGTTLEDSSSSGINGSILGPSWTTEGRNRNALSFDGIDDYIDLTNSFWGGKFVNLDGNTTNFSISAWIKLGSYPTEYTTIVGQRYGDTMTFGIDPSGKVYLNMDDTRTGSPKSTSTVPIDKWTHVAVSFIGTGASDSTAYFYINGQSDGSGYAWDGNGSSSQNYLYVGWQARPDIGADSYFPGDIDELRIYDDALSQKQVSIDYNKGMTATFSQSPPSVGNVWGGSTSSQYCIPGDTSTCSPPVGEWLLDENQGSLAKDTSGNGNSGTLVNNPPWRRGIIGSSLLFDGTDQMVNVGQDTSLDLTTQGTISFWAKTDRDYPSDSTSTRYRGLVCKTTGGSTGQQSYYIDWTGTDTTRTLRARIGNSSGSDGIASSDFDFGESWNFLSFTFDGSSFSLYKNGSLISTGPQSINAQTLAQDTHIGRCFNSTSYSWDGLIDQVRIYDYARTPAQIAWDYNGGEPIGHWRLDECQGSTIHDVSGNGNNGTISIGTSGSQNSLGTCDSVSSSSAWYNGKSGKLNSSLRLDGTDDIASIPNHSLYQFGTGPFTISLWANPSTTVANYDVIFSKSSGLNHYNYVNSLFSAYGELRWYLAHNSETLWNHYVSFGTNSSFTDEWNHFLLVRDATSIKGYLNGELTDESTLPANYDLSNSYSIDLGKEGSIGTYFDGKIDDLRIYNYPLTEKQIQLLYNDNAAVRF